MKVFTTTRGSCSTTWPRPTPSARLAPVEMQRPAAGDVGAGPGQRLELARGDHLGQHHRDGLERLDLLLGIDALGPVLHHQHAERLAAAQDRHAEEGVVDLLARLGLVGEGGVVLRVGQS